MSGLVQGYDELRLRLDRSRGGHYRLLATTHFAEATVEFDIPAAELGLAGVGPGSNRSCGQLATASPSLNDAKRLGEALFRSLSTAPFATYIATPFCEGARSSRHDPFSGVAGALIQPDVPAVIAMQFEISDDSAITFAASFYEALAAGAAVDASLTTARLSMFANHTEDADWGKPVLFMRVADAQLFDVLEPPLTSPDAMDDRASARDASSLRVVALALVRRWRSLLRESTRQPKPCPELCSSDLSLIGPT